MIMSLKYNCCLNRNRLYMISVSLLLGLVLSACGKTGPETFVFDDEGGLAAPRPNVAGLTDEMVPTKGTLIVTKSDMPESPDVLPFTFEKDDQDRFVPQRNIDFSELCKESDTCKLKIVWSDGESDTDDFETVSTLNYNDDGTSLNLDFSYNANSMMGLIATNPKLSILAGALRENFQEELDTPGQNWTVFAPTNVYVEAAISESVDINTEFLQRHIHQGRLAASALSIDLELEMSDGSMYKITQGSDDGLQIGDVSIIEPDLPADNGALHIIDGVLPSNNN